MKLKDWLELTGDGIIIGAGITYIVIFVQIYFLHLYGAENNPWILGFEMAMGPVICALGIYLLVRDARRINKRE
jgi:hypothetical protein